MNAATFTEVVKVFSKGFAKTAIFTEMTKNHKSITCPRKAFAKSKKMTKKTIFTKIAKIKKNLMNGNRQIYLRGPGKAPSKSLKMAKFTRTAKNDESSQEHLFEFSWGLANYCFGIIFRGEYQEL